MGPKLFCDMGGTGHGWFLKHPWKMQISLWHALAGQSRREKNVGGTAKKGGKREGQSL